MKTFNKEIFRAYDIRGIFPEEINEELVYAIAQAYIKLVKPKTVVVGHDVRKSSPVLYQALIKGLVDAGIDVVTIDGISTEMLYFCVGYYQYDGGIIVTASHNPGQYNGLKMVKKGVEPISGETGVYAIRDLVPDVLKQPIRAQKKGITISKNFFEDYKKFVLQFIDVNKIKPLKIVANANFGYQFQFAKKVLENLPITLIGLNHQPDGTFPKGQPDPFLPQNRQEFVERVKKEQADFGVAWDADADRTFFATGSGKFIEAYYMNVLLAQKMLKKYPKSKILYDVRYTWALIDNIPSWGGTALQSRAGHSYIKAMMRKENIILGAESSGHYIFKDFYFADSGIIPLLLILELVSESPKTLEDLVEPYISKYHISGEINITVENADQVINNIKEQYSKQATEIDETDRLTMAFDRIWRFNIRTSNTEPLLRLNVEGNSPKIVKQKTQEVLRIIKAEE